MPWINYDMPCSARPLPPASVLENHSCDIETTNNHLMSSFCDAWCVLCGWANNGALHTYSGRPYTWIIEERILTSALGEIGNIVKCYASLYCATSCQRHVIFHDVGLFTLLFCLRKCEFHRDVNWRVSSGRWKRPEICHQLLLDSISSPSLYSGMYFWPFVDHNIQCSLSVSSRYS